MISRTQKRLVSYILILDLFASEVKLTKSQYSFIIATWNILNSSFDEFDIYGFFHDHPSYLYFVNECPLRIFRTHIQNFAMLQNLTYRAFDGVSANRIFVIFFFLMLAPPIGALFSYSFHFFDHTRYNYRVFIY